MIVIRRVDLAPFVPVVSDEQAKTWAEARERLAKLRRARPKNGPVVHGIVEVEQ